MQLRKSQWTIECFGKVCITIGVISLIANIYFVFAFGGDTLSGMIQNAHYYLGYKGNLTQVSKSIYITSLWNERLGLVIWPVGMLSLLPTPLRQSQSKRAASQ